MRQRPSDVGAIESAPWVRRTSTPESAGVGEDRLEEVAERCGRDAEAATFGRAQKRFVKHLAGVFYGAALEGVVEGAGDDGFPEVANGAVGLVGALEPVGKGFGVVLRVAAEELREARGDGGLVAQGEHGGAEKAESVVRRRGKAAGTYPALTRFAGTGRFEEAKLVVPAHCVSRSSLGDQVDEVGAAAEDDVLGVDGFVECRMRVRVGAAS